MSASTTAAVSFYRDPSAADWQSPNLVAGLMASPTLESLQPPDRQSTVVLAWLVHHSRVFATSLLERFFAGDQVALASLHLRSSESAPEHGEH